MGSYFKPWRRKIGVMTLVMAYVFAAGWVRSLSIVDSFDSNLFPNETLRSHVGEIYWYSQTDSSFPGAPMIGWWVNPASTMGAQEFEGQWGAVGFGFIRGPRGKTIGIPYWSIVIPLTLLSTYLLLSKPRTKPAPMQKARAEPGPETVS